VIKAKRVAGSTIEVDVTTFLTVLEYKKSGLIVTAKCGFFSTKYQYQISYKDFIFLLQTSEPIMISEDFMIVVAEKIQNPVLAMS
jgi:hypothetical protein